MKANAPKKIWIDPATDLPKLSGHIDKDSVEYIRKDAFIEKAVNWLRNNMLSYVDVDMDYESMELNLKFYNDFKRAMKGENE